MNIVVERSDIVVERSVDHIEKRNQDINQVYKDLNELKELQREFAILVTEQGSQLTHIEDLMESTKHQVTQGRDDVKQAIEYNNSFNKTRNLVLLGATGIVLVTTPLLSVISQVGIPLLSAAVAYPKISIPIGALLTLKFI